MNKYLMDSMPFQPATKIIFPSLFIAGIGVLLIIISVCLFCVGVWILCLGTCGAKI